MIQACRSSTTPELVMDACMHISSGGRIHAARKRKHKKIGKEIHKNERKLKMIDETQRVIVTKKRAEPSTSTKSIKIRHSKNRKSMSDRSMRLRDELRLPLTCMLLYRLKVL